MDGSTDLRTEREQKLGKNKNTTSEGFYLLLLCYGWSTGGLSGGRRRQRGERVVAGEDKEKRESVGRRRQSGERVNEARESLK